MQKQFKRCTLCKAKPATIKCFDCQTEDGPAKLCYNCDMNEHAIVDHRKEIIPYGQMEEENIQSHHTPLKENAQVSEPSSELKKKLKALQNASSIKFKQSQITDYESQPDENFQKSLRQQEMKAVDLRYKIKFQEQENTIELLKNHLENIEQKHKDHLTSMKQQLVSQEDKMYQAQEECNYELERQKQIFQDKIKGKDHEIEMEKSKNEQLQSKLEELRKTHECKLNELQQELTKYKSQLEQKKLQEEKLRMDCEQQIQETKDNVFNENEKLLNNIKQEFQVQLNKEKEKNEQKSDQILELQKQLSMMERSLKEVESVWRRKVDSAVQEMNKEKHKYEKEMDKNEKLSLENKNLRSELNIHVQENELYCKEKQGLQRQLSQMVDKKNRLDKFIYGNKKPVQKTSQKEYL